MPVGTRGCVKGITAAQLEKTGSQIILANTYHLHLRPGADVVSSLGGLHRFMGWNRPILTDSGGFQIFSLADLAHIDNHGVSFRSHVDGAMLRLDPAGAIRIQNLLGADIIMALDECPALPAEKETIKLAVDRTLRWAEGCREAHAAGSNQWLFGIVQGGTDPDLRRFCAEKIVSLGFDGHALGGLSVGETHQEMVAVLDAVVPLLPADKPRYLMGVGTPRDLLAGVRRGIDMFDCVLPTRNGRNAYAFTAAGPVRLRNEKHRLSAEPLEPGCDCYTCRTAEAGYLRHLFLTGEMLGPILVSIHNLRFFQRFMARIRELIPTGDWGQMLTEYPIAAEAPEETSVEETA
jgi:queuine tRNA-ribosyltransferase